MTPQRLASGQETGYGLRWGLETGVLAGVTRAVLLELAPRLGYEVSQGVFPFGELERAEEVFTTSSVREVMPVAQVDGTRLEPGEAAWELQAALRAEALA